MSPASVPHPRRKQPPEYVIRVLRVSYPALPDGLLAEGRYYGGRNADGDPVLIDPKRSSDKPLRMRGAGLESAVRALNRLGYIVERIPA